MKGLKCIFTALLLLLLMGCIACAEDDLLLDLNETQAEGTATSDADTVPNIEAQGSDEEDLIYVHICGAVNSPGVYALPAGSRIYEVVENAEGFDEQADTAAVNLVEELTDGTQIYIPFIGEVVAVSEETLININQADVDLLCTLPGIGESRAQAIIEYRKEHGGFQTVEELMNVPGIKDGIYDKIYPYIECK